ncbi:hypothetical protein [Marinobacter sp. S0848L]|uniref:hypothetical protein n=1 Tax=Marinobacter sp. S0848L TaxID=2926423 RepID=UPI001FF5FDFA|nr:hypothetical protein [Marinobacter sp. S0848L]MCK0104837.1 hypothetical protein [Marinobacter sp. S0848L]
MKKIIIAAAAATLFSTMATANSGLADRINEVRSYPNKTVDTKTETMTCMKNMHVNKDLSRSHRKTGHDHT